MTTVAKLTTPTAAAEVDARAQRYLTEHQGATYREALAVVLRGDKALAQAYAEPAQRVGTKPPRGPRTAADTRLPTPAVPVTGGDEREIFDWMLRALQDGKAGSLPGALGELSIEAARFMRIGMPAEEAARRAMGLFPHLVAGSKMLITDIRRNRPENTPDPELSQGRPDFVVHLRAEALMQSTGMSYREAVASVLDTAPELKVAYARS